MEADVGDLFVGEAKRRSAPGASTISLQIRVRGKLVIKWSDDVAAANHLLTWLPRSMVEDVLPDKFAMGVIQRFQEHGSFGGPPLEGASIIWLALSRLRQGKHVAAGEALVDFEVIDNGDERALKVKIKDDTRALNWLETTLQILSTTVRLIDEEDGDEAEQRFRSAMRGLQLIIAGGLAERAYATLPRSWATGGKLDPRDATMITVRKLYELADRPIDSEVILEAEEIILVPRIPTHVAEARAMRAMCMLADRGAMYAGYTDDELELLPDGGAQVRRLFDPHTGQPTIEIRTGPNSDDVIDAEYRPHDVDDEVEGGEGD